MTENEAKKKWCPFALNRVIAFCPIDGKPQSRMFVCGEDKPTTTCVGSSCMAWIALQIPVVQNIKTKEIRHLEQGESYDGSTEMLVYRDSVVDGYCGLAVKS